MRSVGTDAYRMARKWTTYRKNKSVERFAYRCREPKVKFPARCWVTEIEWSMNDRSPLPGYIMLFLGGRLNPGTRDIDPCDSIPLYGRRVNCRCIITISIVRMAYWSTSFFLFPFSIFSLRTVCEPWPSGSLQRILPSATRARIRNGAGQFRRDALLQPHHCLDPLLHLRLRCRWGFVSW